jgi:hypothetical protein
MEEKPNDGKPIERVPNAKKETGRHNPKPTHKSRDNSQRGRSQNKVSQYREPDDAIELTPDGQAAYESLIANAPDIDMRWLSRIEERFEGDREKIVTVLQNLALGSRHRDALADVGWTWSNLSAYRTRYPEVANLYGKVRKIGEDFRKILREDEAHRRAYDGVEENVYTQSGKLCGTKIKYSDHLLTLFLKADNPDKFMDRSSVQASGVVLNLNMGLRDSVSDKPMSQGDIVAESPFADEKPEEPGV